MSSNRDCVECFYAASPNTGSPCETCINYCGTEDNWKPRFQGARRDHEGFGAEPLYTGDDPDVATDSISAREPLESTEVVKSLSAPDFLRKAAEIMEERGKTYDSEGGERSMGKTISAFNAITGRDLKEDEGWLLMLLLKQVRQYSHEGYHADSAEDSIAYSALHAESLAR